MLINNLVNRVKVLHPTQHKIGHFGDVLPSQSLDLQQQQQQQQPFYGPLSGTTPVSQYQKKLAATLRGSRPGGAIRIAHYDVIDDVITQKL